MNKHDFDKRIKSILGMVEGMVTENINENILSKTDTAEAMDISINMMIFLLEKYKEGYSEEPAEEMNINDKKENLKLIKCN